jgi:hypothetical protein
MEGRISRLDHHDRRFSTPPGYSQTSEARWRAHSTGEGFSRRFPVQTGTGPSTAHREAPLPRSALKRPVESRNSFASISSASGGGSESIDFEPSCSCYSCPNQASIWNSERPSRTDARIVSSDPALQQGTKASGLVDLVVNESSIRTPISNPPRKQNLVSSLISRLRTGRQPAGSGPPSPTSHEVALGPQPTLSLQYPSCDIPEDIPTIDIRNCTPSDSDPDTLPSPNLASSPEPPVRKTVRFAMWSHMRTFERPEWEPTGSAYAEVPYKRSSYRNLLRKVWVVFDRLYGVTE